MLQPGLRRYFSLKRGVQVSSINLHYRADIGLKRTYRTHNRSYIRQFWNHRPNRPYIWNFRTDDWLYWRIKWSYYRTHIWIDWFNRSLYRTHIRFNWSNRTYHRSVIRIHWSHRSYIWYNRPFIGIYRSNRSFIWNNWSHVRIK